MLEVIGGLILLILVIYAIVKVASSGVSGTKKLIWILVLIFLPLIGFIAWAIAGPK